MGQGQINIFQNSRHFLGKSHLFHIAHVLGVFFLIWELKSFKNNVGMLITLDAFSQVKVN